MPISAEVLIQSQSSPVTVSPDAEVKDALSLMIEHDFSQLPVVDGQNALHFVTMDSIVRASFYLGLNVKNLRVADALVKAKTFPQDGNLFDLLDELSATSAVLLVHEGELTGIVTDFDTTQYFRQRTQDVMLVEDIEITLRRHIWAAYNADDEAGRAQLEESILRANSHRVEHRSKCESALKKAMEAASVSLNQNQVRPILDEYFPIKPNKKGFDQLTLNEYIELALSEFCWEQLEGAYNVEKTALRAMLHEVREIRNDLAHFRADLSPVKRQNLQFCADWFQNHPFPLPDPLLSQEEASPNALAGSETLETQQDDFEQHIGENSPLKTSKRLFNSAGKYAKLALYLLKISEGTEVVALPFEKIEKILGSTLPPSAREHPSWWANDSVGHVQSKQWLDAGWRVSHVNMMDEEATFARMKGSDRRRIEFFSRIQHAFREQAQLSDGVVELGATERALAPWQYEDGTKATFSIALPRECEVRLKWFINTKDESKNAVVLRRLQDARAQLEEAVGEKVIVNAASTPRLKNAVRLTIATPLASNENGVETTETTEAEKQVVTKAVAFHNAVAAVLDPTLTLLKQAE